MPVPDQVQDDGFGIQNLLKLLDSGFRRNDKKSEFPTFYEVVKIVKIKDLTLSFLEEGDDERYEGSVGKAHAGHQQTGCGGVSSDDELSVYIHS